MPLQAVFWLLVNALPSCHPAALNSPFSTAPVRLRPLQVELCRWLMCFACRASQAALPTGMDSRRPDSGPAGRHTPLYSSNHILVQASSTFYPHACAGPKPAPVPSKMPAPPFLRFRVPPSWLQRQPQSGSDACTSSSTFLNPNHLELFTWHL